MKWATIEVAVDDDKAQALLAALPKSIDVALRQGMADATSLLLREARTYPPPPDPIQGPARVPVRSFRAGYMTQAGVKAYRTVRIRAKRMKGKGVSMMNASELRYRRTNTLKRSWHRVVKVKAAEIEGRVYSSGQEAPYNRYVMNEADQARIHQGRWRTAQQIAKDSQKDIDRMFASRVKVAVK